MAATLASRNTAANDDNIDIDLLKDDDEDDANDLNSWVDDKSEHIAKGADVDDDEEEDDDDDL